MTILNPRVGTLFRFLPIVAFVAAGVALLLLSNSPNVAHADWSSGNDGRHFVTIVNRGGGNVVYRHVVRDFASTYEYKNDDETYMYLTNHRNSAYMTAAHCSRVNLPYCIELPSNHEVKYRKNYQTKKVTAGYSRFSCVIPYTSYGGCYESTNYVSWHDWPVTADAKRTIIIDSDDWIYSLTQSASDTFETPTYNVD